MDSSARRVQSRSTRSISADDRQPGPGALQASASGVERRTFTVSETATIIGVSRSAAYQWVKDGSIPCIRFGRRVVVPDWAIELVLSNGTPADRGSSAAEDA